MQSEAVRIILVPVYQVDQVLSDIVGEFSRSVVLKVDFPLGSLSNTALVSSSVNGRMVG